MEVIQMSPSYENAAPTILFDIVMSTTACSPTVFDGLLAWANLHEHNPAKAEICGWARLSAAADLCTKG